MEQHSRDTATDFIGGPGGRTSLDTNALWRVTNSNAHEASLFRSACVHVNRIDFRRHRARAIVILRYLRLQRHSDNLTSEAQYDIFLRSISVGLT